MSKVAIGNQGAFPYSPAVRAGDFVFVSGHVAVSAEGKFLDGSIEEQTRSAMDGLKATLQQAGCALADVVKVNVFLTDPRDFSRFNAVYATYFDAAPPARSTVCSDLVVDLKIEIEAIAYKPL